MINKCIFCHKNELLITWQKNQEVVPVLLFTVIKTEITDGCQAGKSVALPVWKRSKGQSNELVSGVSLK